MAVGRDGITVTLWDCPPKTHAALLIKSFYESTWGDHLADPLSHDYASAVALAHDAMIGGRILPNCLETISITFGIEGISRACTHQLVRSRVGAVFGQQGGRDNDWSEFTWRLPVGVSPDYIRDSELQEKLSAVYRYLIAHKVPYQDARYVLPMGLCTNLVAGYNLLALKGLLERRLCNRMHWETNYVARLMADATVLALPWVGQTLRSSCEKRGTCSSVSPMFPPACWTYDVKKAPVPVLAKNHPALEEALGPDEFPGWKERYDWPKESNRCVDFEELDKQRVAIESANPDVVMSMVTMERVLAVKQPSGFWKETEHA